MPKANTFSIALVTAPDLRTARRLARAALAAHLVACVNVIAGIESHYRWRGKTETAKEVLLVMKTAAHRVAALQELVLAQHPYETPEFIVLPVKRGSVDYLRWWRDCLEF